MYLAGTQYTDADFAAAIQELHGYAASIADSKQRFQATGDTRYIQSVQSMVPYYQRALQKAKDINAALSGQELPSSLDSFLATSLSWITDAIALAGTIGKNTLEAAGQTVQQVPNVVKNLTSLPVLLLIAGAAFLFVGGGKFIPKRKS